MSETSRQISYRKPALRHAQYQRRIVNPDEQRSIALTTSNTPATFRVNSQVHNPAQSNLYFEMNIPATASLCHILWVLGHTQIKSLMVTAPNGYSIVNNPDENQWSRATALYLTNISDFLARDSNLGDTVIAEVEDTGGSLSSSKSAMNDSLLRANLATFAANITTNGTATSVVDFGAHTVSSNRPVAANGAIDFGVGLGLEPQYVVGAASNTIYVGRFRLPLSDFSECFAAINKSVYIPGDLRYQFNFCSIEDLGWDCTTINVWQTGQAPMVAAVQMNNVQLELMVETDEQNIADLRSVTEREGVKYLCPRRHSQNSTVTSATNSSYQFRIDPSQGQRLLRVYNADFGVKVSAVTNFKKFDISNVPTTSGVYPKVVSMRTSLNNLPIQLQTMQCDDGDDYNYMKQSGMLKDSPVHDVDSFRFNRCYVDSWADPRPLHEQALMAFEVKDGLPITTGGHIYSYTKDLAAAAVSLDQRSWVVTQDELLVQGNNCTYVTGLGTALPAMM